MTDNFQELRKQYGGNYSELSNGLHKVEANLGAVSLFTVIREAEQHLEVI